MRWFLGILLVLTACTSNTELEQQQALWNSQRPAHYRYVVQILCFCSPEITQPVRIEVKNGQTVSVVDATTGQPNTNTRFAPLNTLDKMFGVIQEAIARPVDKLEAKYDGTYGFPTLIRLDPILNAVDDEIQYSIRDFEVLP